MRSPYRTKPHTELNMTGERRKTERKERKMKQLSIFKYTPRMSVRKEGMLEIYT